MQRNQQRQSNYYLHPPNKMSLPFTLVLCFVVGIVTADDATTTTPVPASGVTSTSTSTSSEAGAITNAPTTIEAITSPKATMGTTLKVVVLNVPTTPAVKPFFLSNEPSPSNKENNSSPDTKVNTEPPKEMKASEAPVVITPASVGETGATVTPKAEEREVKMTTEDANKKATDSTPDTKSMSDVTTVQAREQRQADAETTTSGSTMVDNDGSSPTVDSATVRIVGTTVNFTAIDIMLKSMASSTQNDLAAGTGSTPPAPTEKASDVPTTGASTVAERAAETTKQEETTKTAESEKPTVSPLIQMLTNTMTSIGESKNAAETIASASTAADTSSAVPLTTSSK